MFGYDSQEDYFDYQDQVAAEAREAAAAFNAQEAYWAACEESDDWTVNGFGADA